MFTPDGPIGPIAGQLQRQLPGAVIVEAHPVEQCAVLGRRNNRGSGLPRLRLSRDRADLRVAESQRAPQVFSPRPSLSKPAANPPSVRGNRTPRTQCWPAPDHAVQAGGATFPGWRWSRLRRATSRIRTCGCVRPAPGRMPAAARRTSQLGLVGGLAVETRLLAPQEDSTATVGVEANAGQFPAPPVLGFDRQPGGGADAGHVRW